MSSDFPTELRAELLDDFYAECDELLGGIRAELVLLDTACRERRTDAPALEALYRRMHSFKGISAIVGLRAAEQLAHAAEESLRRLSRGETPLTAERAEALGHVAHRLEQIVTAHRLKQPLPDAADVLERLGAPAAPADAATSSATHAEPATGAPSSDTPEAASDLPRWAASFAPSVELDQRGININTVRARLAALGPILRAAPSIQGPGKIAFEFTLALAGDPGDPAAWERDGITLRLLEPAAPASAPTAETPGDVAPSSMFVAPSHIVRVDLSRLDDLMRIAGELTIHRSRLEERIAKIAGDRSALQEVNQGLGRSLRQLREAITRVRLVPVAEIFTRLPFVVRDLARDTGKHVQLVLEGQDTEIDKYLVERLKEPLLHLVRNAISHGVEPAAERVAAGKPPEAILLARASTEGDTVVIQIRDDGRGVDAAQIGSRAAALGLAVPATLDHAAVLDLLCAPGFSTREEADRASGRGVGMAVVATTLRELGGRLALETVPGAWTQFTLRLPLTLSIAETFVVSAGGQTCAVPHASVEEIVQISADDVRPINGVEIVSYRSGVLPLIRLRELFGAEPATLPHLPVLVIRSDRGISGLVVDRVHGQREVVVRPMHDPLIRVPGVSGATELGDGKPVLILDAPALIPGVVRPHARAAAPVDEPLLLARPAAP